MGPHSILIVPASDDLTEDLIFKSGEKNLKEPRKLADMSDMAAFALQSVQVAGRILRAVEQGSIETLREELERSQRLCKDLADSGCDDAEQLDLLDAITVQMRQRLAGASHDPADAIAPQAHLALLRHLAVPRRPAGGGY